MKNLKDLWERSPELVDGIGGERLARSGFESEEPDLEFATTKSGKEGEE